MLLEILVLLLTVAIVQWNIRRWKYLKPLNRYKGPTPLPIIGNALDKGLAVELMMAQSLKDHVKYGRTIKFFLGLDVFLQTTDPSMIEFICSNNKFNAKSNDYRFFKNWLGQGLLTSDGEKWKTHRRILTPSFHYKILEEFVPIFDNAGKILVAKLQSELDNNGFDIYDYITLLTLDIICDTAMGTPIEAQNFPNSDYVHSIKDMCDIITKRVFSLLWRQDWLYKYSALFRRELGALSVIKDHSSSVINKRKHILMDSRPADKSPTKRTDDIGVGIKERFTFMDVLLKSNINDKDIRDEVDTFMFEGHDTTAVAISFILYCLSTNPECQSKAYDEIKDIFGDDRNRPASYGDLQSMKYLEMVIKESLRLYPSVPGFIRQIHEDIEYDGTVLPKETNFVIAVYEMHRNAELYPDPEIFDPERFTLENSSRRHPYSYLPFSAGARNCIGQKFAMLEMKSTVSKMLLHFKLMPTIPAHAPHLITKLTIFSSNGIKLRISKR